MLENSKRIPPDVLLALQSEYLSHGYKQDHVNLSHLVFSNGGCESVFKMQDAYAPSDGHFHLSMTTAINCISQTGIIYAGLLNGLKRKENEVYVLDFKIRFHRAINDDEFAIQIAVEKKRKSTSGIIYYMQGNVQDRAFTYDVKFLFPLTETTV
ncbi:hypothetical protein N4G41_00645 [Kosakonia sacchari]|uniref:hypothetical protein n=1 Tax=Kosakonia sacchari TaxID=1158459 RepID=UPI002ACEBE32|nr:hypothetical protein [Kosakonia sacchari]MDZ7320143.1 hypothetical protein [Kosakonia sacchari]